MTSTTSMTSNEYQAIIDRLIHDISALTGRPVKVLRLSYNLPVLPDAETESPAAIRPARAVA